MPSRVLLRVLLVFLFADVARCGAPLRRAVSPSPPPRRILANLTKSILLPVNISFACEDAFCNPYV